MFCIIMYHPDIALYYCVNGTHWLQMIDLFSSERKSLWVETIGSPPYNTWFCFVRLMLIKRFIRNNAKICVKRKDLQMLREGLRVHANNSSKPKNHSTINKTSSSYSSCQLNTLGKKMSPIKKKVTLLAPSILL